MEHFELIARQCGFDEFDGGVRVGDLDNQFAVPFVQQFNHDRVVRVVNVPEDTLGVQIEGASGEHTGDIDSNNLIPCHQLCVIAASTRIAAMCSIGISSELFSAQSLSAPRTCKTSFPSATVKSTIYGFLFNRHTTEFDHGTSFVGWIPPNHV